jgi:hypothetical protein
MGHNRAVVSKNMPQPGGCVKNMPQPGGCVKKWATTGRLCVKKWAKPGGCVKKTAGRLCQKNETGRLRQKSRNRAVASKKVETGRLRQKSRNRAVASKKRPVASKKGRNRPVASKKRPVASKKSRKRPVASKTPGRVHFPHHFPSFLSLSCSNHQYIHHQSLLCAQYCTLNAKECQKNETTPQTFMK